MFEMCLCRSVLFSACRSVNPQMEPLTISLQVCKVEFNQFNLCQLYGYCI